MVPQVILPTGELVHLGAILVENPKPAPRLDRYLTPYLAVAPPVSIDNTTKSMDAIRQMLANNRYGCCVMSGCGHAGGIWTGQATGKPAVGNDQETADQYFSICGGGDNGCVVTNVLDHFRDYGLSIGGVIHKIDGYVSVDNTNKPLCQIAVTVFGLLVIAVNLPGGWESSDVWDVTNSGFIGGHCVVVVGYNDQGLLISTWGKIVTMTWAAFLSTQYVVEAYPPLSPDWYSVAGQSPYGIKVDALKADQDLIKAGNIPPYDPGPNPGPGPNPDPTPTPGPNPTPWSWMEIA